MRYQLGVPEVARLVRESRERQGLSQRRLALRAGTSQAAISRIERGLEAPTTERLRDVLRVLGHSVVLDAEPAGDADPDRLQLTPSERLRESASWNLVATTLEIAGVKARRADHPATRRSQ